MIRLTMTAGAGFGLLSVALGAFGAHGLKGLVSAELLGTWATASEYLGMHALALLAAGTLAHLRPTARLLSLVAACFMAGTLIFSGSLYLRVLTDIGAWGAVTPVGGTLLIAGWALFALAAWRSFGDHDR